MRREGIAAPLPEAALSLKHESIGEVLRCAQDDKSSWPFMNTRTFPVASPHVFTNMFKCSLPGNATFSNSSRPSSATKVITPSTREIQEHFGFASQTSVMQYLAALERKGVLQRHARKARALITAAPKTRVVDIPIYGEIPAGMATFSEENIEGHVALDLDSLNARAARALLLYACAAIP